MRVICPLPGVLLSVVLVLSSFTFSTAEVRLPALISDGMILQRDTELRIWGWAAPRETVKVEFNHGSYVVTADSKGKWITVIPPLQAGGPYDMRISASNSVVIKDILVGEVWLCSGQSNMEIPMSRVSWRYPEEIANANYDNIRMFAVARAYDFKTPLEDVTGSWFAADSAHILRWSALAYFFAKGLQAEQHVPVGIVFSAYGGAPVEAWMSEDVLHHFPELLEKGYEFRNDTMIRQIQQEDRTRIGKWYAESKAKDQGYMDKCIWSDPKLNTKKWSTMQVPGYWENTPLGEINGVVWFRREVDVPEQIVESDVTLVLGCIVDADSTFVNGKYVGNITYRYPPRRYRIPPGVLHAGKNTIAIRVVNSGGTGGFVEGKQYALVTPTDTFDISGEWKYRLGTEMPPLKGQNFVERNPMGLYNAMMHPLLQYRIKGILWYQGESNALRAMEYRRTFPAMIRDWREKWNQGILPFIFVQLPNFAGESQGWRDDWALMRESQAAALSLPGTAMAVTIDIGEWNDLHPLNKKDVAARLLLAARKLAYHEDVVSSGPMYKTMTISDRRIEIEFSDVGHGLVTHGTDGVHEFVIAGADRIFYPAAAVIKGNRVIVESPEVSHPVAVRYAWSNNPEDPNLYNADGLPAAPFRTDDWMKE